MSMLSIDTERLLDSSTVGATAAQALEKLWTDGAKFDDDRKRALLLELQTRRDQLRARLLERAAPFIAELAKKKKATAVIERSTLRFSALEDITDAVIAKVDALGPLK